MLCPDRGGRVDVFQVPIIISAKKVHTGYIWRSQPANREKASPFMSTALNQKKENNLVMVWFVGIVLVNDDDQTLWVADYILPSTLLHGACGKECRGKKKQAVTFMLQCHCLKRHLALHIYMVLRFNYGSLKNFLCTQARYYSV